MTITPVFAGIPVADRGAAVDWYARLSGRAPDLIPNQDEAAWQLNDTAWVYVITNADRAGSALITFLVDDLDAFPDGLAERGIAAAPVETVAGDTRRTIVTDPDGNRLQIGQPPTVT